MYQTNNEVSRLSKPKRKIIKFVLVSIAIIFLTIGVWVGFTAYKTLKKVTALSGGNNSILSLFNTKTTNLRGQSQGRTNILLLGIGGGNHPGATLSDTLQVISINWQTNQVSMISVPRDLWVNIPGHGYSKINEANSSGGGDLASQVVGQVLGINIDYYVTLDFDGFKEIINTIGGVDINVPTAIYDPNYPLYDNGPVTTFSISAGPHHMDGDLALKYARSRESTSDFDRSHRQQLIMQAIKIKVLSAGILANPEKITSLMNSIGNHLKMNLAISEIKPLYDEIQKVDTANMITKVIDNSANGVLASSQSSGGADILIPKKGIGNYGDLQSIARNIFSTTGGATLTSKTNPLIEVLNGSGVSGRGTTVANTLKNNGFTVSSIATTSKIAKTTVYNCSGNEVDTSVQKIVTLLGATSSTKTSCGAFDIEVVIGQN